MILPCLGCHGPIRDCTAFETHEFGHVTVRGWYHVNDGNRWCEEGRMMAKPVALVSVSCPAHHLKAIAGCLLCFTSAQVSLYFHNHGRCIPRSCGWTHV